MGRFWFVIYNLLVPIMLFGFWISSFFNRKTRESFAGRIGQERKLKDFFAEVPDQAFRLWVHCVSVGEWLQAVPVLKELRKSNPRLIIVVSFFSPSGFNYVKESPLMDYKFYLPFDSFSSARNVFQIIRPDLWIVSKFDVWPNHLYRAGKQSVPTVLIAATLSANSGRLSGPIGALNRFVYQNFQWLFAISEPDRDRFLSLYPNRDHMLVVGDTRFDSVFQKSEDVRAAHPVPILDPAPDLTILAGSTWPSDEQHLLPAIRDTLIKHPGVKAVIVPHELDENHLVEIESFFADVFKVERYSSFAQLGHTGARVAIMDVIGQLAGLYLNCDLAYVGGSFGAGVHNVMEPAVFGKPVLFGPKHINSFEALELKRLGGGFEVTNQAEIAHQLDILVSNAELRATVGKIAQDLVMNNLGATEKILEKLRNEYDFIS